MWVGALAVAILVLTYSGAIQESFADTDVGFIKRGSITDDPGNINTRLSDITDMLYFKLGQTNYIVASGIEGAHLVVVDNTGSLSTTSVTGGVWGTIENLVIYESTVGTRIAGLYSSSSSINNDQGAIQIFRVNASKQLTSVGAVVDTKLFSPKGMETYSPTTGKHYAVTVSGAIQNNSYVNIINITDPTNPAIVRSLQDAANLSLRNPTDIDIYTTNNKYYAAVISYSENAVNIIDITDPMNISVVGKLLDTSAYLLRAPDSLEIYSTGGKHYAVVVPRTGHLITEAGIQIIDISTPETPTAVGKLQMDYNNKRYGDAIDLTLHSYNDRWYALLVGEDGYNSLQIIDITDPSAPVESSFIHPANTYEKVTSVESYVVGERHFASVGTERITGSTNPLPGIDILEMAFLTANAGPDQTRTYGQTVALNGAAAVTVPGKTFSHTWTQTHGPDVGITGNTALRPTFTAPNQDATLTFTLTVTLPASQGVITSDTTAGKLTATDTVTINVANANQIPTANAGADKTFALGALVTLSGSGTDPNGDSLTYEWIQTPGTPRVTIDDYRSARTTFTAPSDPTKLVFTLTVSDGINSDTDDVTITIANQTRNIKELKDTLVQGQITEPIQSTDPDQVGGTDLITGSNEITMIYTEPIATFINSYLNFTISGEDKPRNITGINGSPAIETGETVRINGKLVKTYSTILTFDGPPVPPGSTGSMYVQHADYYLAKVQIRDGQN